MTPTERHLAARAVLKVLYEHYLSEGACIAIYEPHRSGDDTPVKTIRAAVNWLHGKGLVKRKGALGECVLRQAGVELWEDDAALDRLLPVDESLPTSPSVDATDTKERSQATASAVPHKIFIGHGRSPAWQALKGFLEGGLKLYCSEFNSDSVAGLSIKGRLETMLSEASFAFLVMTAEDEHADGTKHARANVIHEVGLFQGKLGFNRAIVLLEDGCAEPSNLHGTNQIRFPKGAILDKADEIRGVLERENIIDRG